MREEETKIHPSYGLIRFSRVQGSSSFFGSDSNPDSYIHLVIKEAEEKKDLVRSWFYGRKQVLSLRLTSNQFAELITSLNMGDGVPCTIEYTSEDGVIVQESDKEYKVDFHKRKTKDLFENSLLKIKEWAKDVEEVGKKLPKKDQEFVKGFTSRVVQELSLNMPFFMECFYEQMEKVSQEIKSNLEADVLHKLTSLGLETFKQKQLEDGK